MSPASLFAQITGFVCIIWVTAEGRSYYCFRECLFNLQCLLRHRIYILVLNNIIESEFALNWMVEHEDDSNNLIINMATLWVTQVFLFFPKEVVCVNK